MDKALLHTTVRKNPKENKVGEKRGAIISALNQATAKFVKNSENIFPIKYKYTTNFDP